MKVYLRYRLIVKVRGLVPYPTLLIDLIIRRRLAFQQPEGCHILAATVRPGADADDGQGRGHHLRVYAQQGLPAAGYQP